MPSFYCFTVEVNNARWVKCPAQNHVANEHKVSPSNLVPKRYPKHSIHDVFRDKNKIYYPGKAEVVPEIRAQAECAYWTLGRKERKNFNVHGVFWSPCDVASYTASFNSHNSPSRWYFHLYPWDQEAENRAMLTQQGRARSQAPFALAHSPWSSPNVSQAV